jgi:hypothetical protein
LAFSAVAKPFLRNPPHRFRPLADQAMHNEFHKVSYAIIGDAKGRRLLMQRLNNAGRF